MGPEKIQRVCFHAVRSGRWEGGMDGGEKDRSSQNGGACIPPPLAAGLVHTDILGWRLESRFFLHWMRWPRHAPNWWPSLHSPAALVWRLAFLAAVQVCLIEEVANPVWRPRSKTPGKPPQLVTESGYASGRQLVNRYLQAPSPVKGTCWLGWEPSIWDQGKKTASDHDSFR